MINRGRAGCVAGTQVSSIDWVPAVMTVQVFFLATALISGLAAAIVGGLAALIQAGDAGTAVRAHAAVTGKMPRDSLREGGAGFPSTLGALGAAKGAVYCLIVYWVSLVGALAALVFSW